MSAKAPFTINKYTFDGAVVDAISRSQEFYENSLWPLVYILKDDASKQAYIGETTDAPERMKAHLKNEQKQLLSDALLISSDKFNKSATLDIESSLIRYMSADESYKLINGNVGIANHRYFQQKELYEGLFEQIWDELLALKIVRHPLQEINNSDLFKYSPYKALSPDQIISLKEMLSALVMADKKHIMVSGGAGTGKSVLAIFLFKLLNTDLETFKFAELGAEDNEIIELVKVAKLRFPDLKMGLVVPMASFRGTVKNIFAQVKGLKKSMVLSPSDVAKQHYDILLVDEAHRLRRRVALGALYKSFDDNSRRLGLDPYTTSELQWVTKQSDKAILFYDAGQSVRPSDVRASEFDQILAADSTVRLTLKSQLRSKGGEKLVRFLNGLLQIDLAETQKLKRIRFKEYEFLLFDRLEDLIRELDKRETAFGLSRVVAGYAWPWVSKKNKTEFDINLDDVLLRWNSSSNNWIYRQGCEKEVGCIHTVQGYDLNYTGVIFGPEITYNTHTGLIEVIKGNYHDRTGKTGIKDPKELHRYIQHIYSTLILRGIEGAFIYVADPALKDYFARYIDRYDANYKGKFNIKVPLIQLSVESDALVEVSRSEIDMDGAHLTADRTSLIACQVRTQNKLSEPTIALLRIVYEELGVEHEYLSGQYGAPTEIRQVAEKPALYEKQVWQPDGLHASRFISLRLKDEDGGVRSVVTRFERLLKQPFTEDTSF